MLFKKQSHKKPYKHEHSHPLKFSELDEATHARIDRIADEFQAGFSLLKSFDKSVTFWGSARTLPDEKDYKLAKALAGRLSKEGYTVVTGGGPGIMAAGNCGAYDAGGRSVGLTIKLPMEQKTNVCVTDPLDFKYFFARKVCLAYAAEAYLYFPGGFGTLDELFEILTLVQTKKIEPAPAIILVGSHYWNDLDHFIKKQLLKKDKISPGDLNLYTITDDHDEIVEIVKNAPYRKG
jgi:uncharacterized protein (TIGR00730 family)